MNNVEMTCICGQHDSVDAMNLVPSTMRTAESELRYQCAKILGDTNPLDEEPHIIDYKRWYVIKARYPYDMVFEIHDLLIPRSGVADRLELTVIDLTELELILDELGNQYDMVFENFKHRRSVPGLYHLHLARQHRDRANFKL